MCLISHNIYNRTFGRKTDKPFDEIDLKGTHYEPYMDKIAVGMKMLRSLNWKKLYVKGVNGDKLAAYYYDCGSDRTAILCHGYRSHYFSNAVAPGTYFKNAGYNLLILVLRGHEESEGKYITFGELEHKDLLIWVDKVEKDLGCKKIVLYGVSLGSNTVMRASEFISSKAVKAIVCDCGFINTMSIIKTNVKARCSNWFQSVLYSAIATPLIAEMRLWGRKLGKFDIFHGDTRKSISANNIPAFFIHGQKDKVVPISATMQNFAACNSEKDIYISKNAAHGAAFLDGGDVLSKKLDAFLGRFV